MNVSPVDKWKCRGRIFIGLCCCLLTLFFMLTLFFCIFFTFVNGHVEITEKMFWAFSAMISCLSATIGGLFVSGFRAWDIQGLIYRIENKWTANLMKTGVEELMRERKWNDTTKK